jgi:leader peptidase (prepilin peptidase)/N-methyltransferase
MGSFLNVVILRFNTGFSVAKGRSKCFSCDKTLYWYELIPLLSFIAQNGKCRVCDSKISWQYPIVELATAIILPAIFYVTSGLLFFVPISAIFCLYIVIFVYDLRHKIIPDSLSYAAALIALVVIGIGWYTTGFLDLNVVIAGPVLFLFFYFFWFVSRGRWMGLGDAKLALSVGWLLGLWGGVAAILMSFWIGAIFSLLLILSQKLFIGGNLGMKSEIPFGPFILIGLALVFFFHIDIQSILAHLAL